MASNSSNANPADAVVLLVDDDPAVAKLLEVALPDAGFDVLVARDGAAALEILETEPVSVVLLDIVMPTMSGQKVLEQIRRRPEVEKLPVIFLTSSNALDSRLDGLDAGADDYITKPFAIAELIARVRVQVRRHAAWTSSLTALERRLDAVVLLRAIRHGTDATSIATSVCSELIRYEGVTAVGILAFHGSRTATSLAGAGAWANWLEPGAPLDPRVARILTRAVEHGPIVARANSRQATDLAAAGLPRATGEYDVALAPIFGIADALGVLAIGTESRGDQSYRNEILASAIDFAAVLSALIGPALEGRAVTDLARSKLAGLIDAKAFTPTYQPVVELSSGKVVGIEGLTRWNDGIRPDLRFSEAHSLDLGIAAEAAVAAEILRCVPPTMPADTWLSINASPELVLSGALDELLDDTRQPIVLELTEHEEVSDYDALRAALRRYPDVLVAVDDAGSGYASLNHVLDLRPDIVKLDINWVRNVDRDPARQALMSAMVGFAREMGMRVIAEGIETNAEHRTLVAIGVELGQGYLFSPPALAGDVSVGTLQPRETPNLTENTRELFTCSESSAALHRVPASNGGSPSSR